MQTDLTALIERVESGGDLDRELDGDIAVAIYGGEIVWKTANYTMEQHPARRHPSRSHVGGFANAHVPHLTSSLDAALCLVGEKLPGWRWSVELGHPCEYEGSLFASPSARPMRTGKASSPARALLAAALRAIQESRNAD